MIKNEIDRLNALANDWTISAPDDFTPNEYKGIFYALLGISYRLAALIEIARSSSSTEVERPDRP